MLLYYTLLFYDRKDIIAPQKESCQKEEGTHQKLIVPPESFVRGSRPPGLSGRGFGASAELPGG